MLVDDCTRQEHDTRPEHSRPTRGCSHLLACRDALLCCLDRDALLSCLVPPSRPEHARIACLLPPSGILVACLYHAVSHTCHPLSHTHDVSCLTHEHLLARACMVACDALVLSAPRHVMLLSCRLPPHMACACLVGTSACSCLVACLLMSHPLVAFSCLVFLVTLSAASSCGTSAGW